MEVDDVLRQGIQGISELITEPGLVNLDFADVKTIMSESGGGADGDRAWHGRVARADAARMAISSPLLDISMEGARGVLLNITGGSDLALSEINEAADIVSQAADPEANIIFGAVIDPTAGERGQDHRHRDGLRRVEPPQQRGTARVPRPLVAAAVRGRVAAAQSDRSSGSDAAARSKTAIGPAARARYAGRSASGRSARRLPEPCPRQRGRRPGYSAVPARPRSLGELEVRRRKS